MNPFDGRVVSNVICQALAGEDITVYGDGQQTRSFCYVSDLVDGFLRLMAYEGRLPGAVNLGNPNELTIADLVTRVLSMTDLQIFREFCFSVFVCNEAASLSAVSRSGCDVVKSARRLRRRR